jgi:hypothetical protein
LFIFFSKANANQIFVSVEIDKKAVAKSLNLGGFMRVIIFSGLLLLAACSTKETTEKVDDRMDALPAQAVDVSEETHEAFLEAPGLSSVEKDKLKDVHEKTLKQEEKIAKQMDRHKVALFEALSDPDVKKGEVRLLKRRMIDLERKKLDLTFKSLEEVAGVVGKNPEAMSYYRKSVLNDQDADEEEDTVR